MPKSSRFQRDRDCSWFRLPLLEFAATRAVLPKGIADTDRCFRGNWKVEFPRGGDRLLEGVSGPKPQGAGINLRGL